MEVGVNKSLDELKNEVLKFNERLTKLIIEKSELMKAGIAIKAEYMLKIGKYELERYQLFFNIQKIKREIALYQIAQNRGEVITEEEVNAIIEEEIKEYRLQLELLVAQYEFAQEYDKLENISPEEYQEIKRLYRYIVKRIHPDLNDNFNEEMKSLWEMTQDAYNENNLVKLQEVKLLLDSKDFHVITINDFDKLNDQKLTLQRRIYEEKLRIKEMKNQFPYNKTSILQDEEMVKEIVSEIQEEIKELEKTYQELQIRLDFIKDPQHGIS